MSESEMGNELPRPIIHVDECKGCGRCIVACPKKCLALSQGLNRAGLRYAEYSGQGCIGCGICFYACPEPYALDVVKKEG